MNAHDESTTHGARRVVLCRLDEIPIGEGRTFELPSLSVAVFRTRSGKVFATQSACPHRGGPLADGTLGDGVLVCPLHAFRFDVATGAPIGNACASLAVYPVSVTEAGEVVIVVAEPARRASGETRCQGCHRTA